MQVRFCFQFILRLNITVDFNQPHAFLIAYIFANY